MQQFKFNPLINKTPSGVVAFKEIVKYTVEVAQNVVSSKVYFVVFKDGSFEPNKTEMTFVGFNKGYKLYQASIKYDKPGLYWYYFEIVGDNCTTLVQTNDDENEIVLNNGKGFSQNVKMRKTLMTENHNGGVIYHIFVDRFKKVGSHNLRNNLIAKEWNEPLQQTNNYEIINKECYQGNLKGITAKLSHFKNLGVDILYLSPIFYANSNHKYNTADFMQIDPSMGTDEDLQELCDKAHEKGIKILLDGVFNHVGSDSIYFNKEGNFKQIGAYNSKNSKYYSWFSFNNWPNDYSCWWGVSSLPQINENEPTYQKLIIGKNGVIEKYMNLGVSGFRLDVVDELNVDFLEKLCKKIYSINKDAIIIGEVWEDASKKIAYEKRRSYFNGKQLNSVTNYPFKDAILNYIQTGSADLLKNCYLFIQDDYPEFVKNNLMNIVGSHDTTRILSFIKNITKSKSKQFDLLKIATLLQYAFVGNATIYYGDELGLTDIVPGNSRVLFPQKIEPNDILTWYKFLGKLKHQPAFSYGAIELQEPIDGIVVIKRETEQESYLVITNMLDSDYELETENLYKDILSVKQSGYTFTIKPHKFLILKQL